MVHLVMKVSLVAVILFEGIEFVLQVNELGLVAERPLSAYIMTLLRGDGFSYYSKFLAFSDANFLYIE